METFYLKIFLFKEESFIEELFTVLTMLKIWGNKYRTIGKFLIIINRPIMMLLTIDSFIYRHILLWIIICNLFLMLPSYYYYCPSYHTCFINEEMESQRCHIAGLKSCRARIQVCASFQNHCSIYAFLCLIAFSC